jgi:negative regulator of sigma E activity
VSEDAAWLILVDIISRSGNPLNEFTIFDFTMLLHHKVAQEVEKSLCPWLMRKTQQATTLNSSPFCFPTGSLTISSTMWRCDLMRAIYINSGTMREQLGSHMSMSPPETRTPWVSMAILLSL